MVYDLADGRLQADYSASLVMGIIMRIAFALATALFVGTGTASAQVQPQELSQPTITPASTSTPAAASSDQKFCRMTYYNGTVIRSQVCHTKFEWEAIQKRNQQEVNEAQMRGLTSNSPR